MTIIDDKDPGSAAGCHSEQFLKVMPDEASVRQDSLRHERMRSCLSEARTP